jgi:hypothetical protein
VARSTSSSPSGLTQVPPSSRPLSLRSHRSPQEPEPEKKPKPKEAKPKNYGGAGLFTPAGGSSLPTTPEGRSPARTPSSSGALPPSLLPPSLRTSASELYVAPYETGGSYSSSIASSVDSMINDFGEMAVGHHRRESFPVSRARVVPPAPR